MSLSLIKFNVHISHPHLVNIISEKGLESNWSYMKTWSLGVKKIFHTKAWLQGYFGDAGGSAVVRTVAHHGTQVFLILKLSLNFPRLLIQDVDCHWGINPVIHTCPFFTDSDLFQFSSFCYLFQRKHYLVTFTSPGGFDMTFSFQVPHVWFGEKCTISASWKPLYSRCWMENRRSVVNRKMSEPCPFQRVRL